MHTLAQLTAKERQGRILDSLAQHLFPFVSERMEESAGSNWVDLYVADESSRRNTPFIFSPTDVRALLKLVRHKREVFTSVTAQQRTWIDELIQSANIAAHATTVTDEQTTRTIDTARLLAHGLELDGFLEEIARFHSATSTRSEFAEVSNTPIPREQLQPGISSVSATVGALEVVVYYFDALNYSLIHNKISPIVGIKVSNSGEHAVSDIVVELSLVTPGMEIPDDMPLRLPLSLVDAGESFVIGAKDAVWPLRASAFAIFDESVSADVHLRVLVGTTGIQTSNSVRVLPVDQWWSLSIPELLAAFVRPNDPAITNLVREAADLLLQRTGSDSLEGYQTGPQRVHQIAEAVFDALVARNITYLEAPPSFEGTGQRIRSHVEVLSNQQGNCLELACIYAAALEQAGLNPVLSIVEGHAFAGYLTEDQQLTDTVIDTYSSIINFGDSDLFEAVETTAVTASPAKTFDEARASTRHWWGSDIASFEYMLDVTSAHRTIRPLPSISLVDGAKVIEKTVEVHAPVARKMPHTAKGTSHPSLEATKKQAPARVQRWQRALLDLSYRNPLLKLSNASTVSLHIPRGSISKFEDLVSSGTRIQLIGSDALSELHRAQGARSAADIDPAALSSYLEHELRIFAAHSSADTRRRLKNLERGSRTSREETGTDNLYLAVGTLNWVESSREGRAPLFLIPIKLQGGKGNRAFLIELDETREAQPNFCLIEKLRTTWGIEIPALSDPPKDESGIDIQGALAALRNHIIQAQITDFHIDEGAHLALFQFSTLEMWRDLRENWETYTQRATVHHLVHTAGSQGFDDGVEAPETSTTAEAKFFLPISADGTQIEAIAWADAGKSFILEGPPGTGKSQTITNMIAHLLAQGKKVLFVAEKQAALEVVQRRLSSVGLDPYSLDVHGKTQSLNAVREQLSAALDQAVYAKPSWETNRSHYTNLVDSLSRYPNQLHEEGPALLSAWDARQVVLELNNKGITGSVKLPRAIALSADAPTNLYNAAREFAIALNNLAHDPSISPWRFAEVTDISTIDLHALRELVAQLISAEKSLHSPTTAALTDTLVQVQDFELLDKWLSDLYKGNVQPLTTTQTIVNAPWLHRAAETDNAFNVFLSRNAQRLAGAHPDVLDLDLHALIQQSVAADGKFLFKKRARRAVLASIASYLPDHGGQFDLTTLTAYLQALSQASQERRDLTRYVQELPGLVVPPLWNPLHHAQLDAIQSQIAALRTAAALAEYADLNSIALMQIDDMATKLLTGSSTELSDLTRNSRTFCALWQQFVNTLRASPAELSSWTAHQTRRDAFEQDALNWQSDAESGHFIRLARWINVRDTASKLSKAGGQDAVDNAFQGNLSASDLEPTVRLSCAQEILAERLETSGLSRFDERERAAKTSQFIASGTDIRQQLVAELPAKIVGARTFNPNQRSGAIAELRAQLNRRRGGLTVRQLFQQYGGIISEISPCFLMSPNSVARFLPTSNIEFDVVIFDEASQIRVPDAIGAMGRAKSAIIVGDSKQMPPSSGFFAQTASNEEDFSNEIAVPSDMDSILSEAVESRFPSQWLSWHYRSKNESLIAFSNRTYYEGRLASFPSPPPTTTNNNPALTYQNVNGTWEGGHKSARVNREEASAIVDSVLNLLVTNPKSSIGIITFNVQQRNLILDLLEEASVTNAALQAALERDTEPLFVKNLENVQGDERDIILFSLAFSKDSTGKVSRNWGPLSRVGGEKRLNVAVTRAKSQVHIFGSFDPHEFDISGTSSVGLSDLKNYLVMAKSGVENSKLSGQQHTDLHLSNIANAARDAGLEVQEHRGLSDFKVDLAVRAKGQPWMAVMLDGPVWAQRRSVGDRDALPQSVLTDAMGWAKVYRIWLPTWLRDAEGVITELKNLTATLTDEAEDPDSSQNSQHTSSNTEEAVTAILHSSDEETTDKDFAVAEESSSVPTRTPLLDFIEYTHLKYSSPESQEQLNDAKASSITDDESFLVGYFPPEQAKFTEAPSTATHLAAFLDSKYPEDQIEIHRVISDITMVEGPILRDRLIKMLASRFSLSALREQRRQQLLTFLPKEHMTTAPNGDVIVWPAHVDPASYSEYRVPQLGTQRKLNEVPYNEIANAMKVVVRDTQWISQDDLFRETASLFGITRLTAGIKQRLEGVFMALNEQQVFVIDGDRISIKDN